MDNKTPIQEAIEKFERIAEKEQHSFRKAYWTSAVQHLKLLLPKEKEFAENVYTAGARWQRQWDQHVTYEAKAPEAPDKQQFLNQLYPEK